MIFPPLLLSYSHAVYDNFNFLTGVFPFFDTGADDYTGLYYYPQDGELNSLQGMVVSFNNKIMSGSQPTNAVPLVDSSHITGKVVEVPAGHCMAIKMYDSNLYGSQTFTTSFLGTTEPYTSSTINISNLSPGNYNGTQVAYNNNGAIPVSGSSGTNLFSNMDSCYMGNRSVTGLYLSGSYSAIPTIWLIVNDSETSLYLSNESALVTGSPTVTYDIPTLSNDEVCFLFYDVEYGTTSNRNGYRFCIPHINGLVDIYTYQFTNLYRSDSVQFFLRQYDNVICSIGTTQAGNLYVGIDNRVGIRESSFSVNIGLGNVNKSSDFIPYWINSTYTTQRQAIWIKNGYVAITNYDELIDKLQEAGIGQADLSRVIALLEEINTGGEIGEATKQLITILETYHNNLVQQGDSDWSTINNTYDDIKHWLDFSGETIHWIVIANNALFNYFSGFILLCAFFLVIDRIMKG